MELLLLDQLLVQEDNLEVLKVMLEDLVQILPHVEVVGVVEEGEELELLVPLQEEHLAVVLVEQV